MTQPMSLEQWLDNRTVRPDLTVLSRLLLPVARHLAAIHGSGQSHGGLSLEHMAVTDQPGAAELAVRTTPERPRVEATTGEATTGEVGPDDGSETPAADVFALGEIAYRIVIGRMPDHAGINRNTLRSARHLGGDDYPASLLELIDRSLERDPTLRPSASEWVDELVAGVGPTIQPVSVDAGSPERTVATPAVGPASLKHGIAKPDAGISVATLRHSQTRLLSIAGLASLAIIAVGSWLVSTIGQLPRDPSLTAAVDQTAPRSQVPEPLPPADPVVQAEAAKPSATPLDSLAAPSPQGSAATVAEPPSQRLQSAVTISNSPSSPQVKSAPRIRDCPDCPELVVLPAGTVAFALTPPDGSSAAKAKFTIHKPIAIGQYEITRGQFAEFIAATGYKIDSGCYRRSPEWRLDVNLNWNSPGYPQDERHPVACVSLLDAEAYTNWLSQRTGHRYRLPTDPEWHYALDQASSSSAEKTNQCERSNGADMTAGQRNPGWRLADCDDGHAFTAPIGSFKPTQNSLYDLQGNVWEWVTDCQPRFEGGHFDYVACAADGQRMLRGGSWSDPPALLTPDARLLSPPVIRDQIVGFRVVRDLRDCEIASTNCSVQGTPQTDVSKVGLATTSRGAVKAFTADGRERSVTTGSDLFLKETVSTGLGARATLSLGARTLVRLGESASVTLNSYVIDSGGEIEIGSGAIEFDRSGAQSSAPLSFRTAYGLISVRGTTFIAGISAGRYGIFVERGSVDVTSGGQTVAVAAGLGVDIERPGAVPTPPAAWGTARVTEAKASVR